MDTHQDMEVDIKQFLQALEAEVEDCRNTHAPGGFVIPEALNQEMSFVQQARVIADFYHITTEQACFALVGTLGKMGWL